MMQKRALVYAVLTVYAFSTVQTLPDSPGEYVLDVRTDAGELQPPEGNDASSASTPESIDGTTGLESIPEDTNDNVEQFSHSLLQLLLTSSLLLPGDFKIYNIYESFFVNGYTILLRTGITDSMIAEETAQRGLEIGDVDYKLYYNAAVHMLAKIIDTEGVWTKDELTNGPQIVLDLVESYAREFGAFDSNSMLFALDNGIYDYALEIGLINVDSVKTAFTFFNNYMKGLASGILE